MKITSKELEILQTLWKVNKPLNAKQISEFEDGMVMSTVQATLRKLLKKDLIKVDDIVYSGTVLSRSYLPTMIQEEFISMQYDNLSVANFVSYLLESKKTQKSEDEIKEVINLIEEKINKK